MTISTVAQLNEFAKSTSRRSGSMTRDRFESLCETFSIETITDEQIKKFLAENERPRQIKYDELQAGTADLDEVNAMIAWQLYHLREIAIGNEWRKAQKSLPEDNPVNNALAANYTKPYFVKTDDDDWAVIARGIDFQMGPRGWCVRVTKKDGSSKFVYTSDAVNPKSTVVKEYIAD